MERQSTWFVPLLVCVFAGGVDAAPFLPTGSAGKPEGSPPSAWFMPPTRVVWMSAPGFTHAHDLLGTKLGQAAWLRENVLGVTPLEPSFKRVRIVPQLGPLTWAEGTYPTPFGPIKVRHERQTDGPVKSQIDAPAGIVVGRN